MDSGPPAAALRPQNVRRALQFGTGEENLPIPAASPKSIRDEYPDRVLISRVRVGVSTASILEYVKGFAKNVLKVTQMKTRIQPQRHLSFVVEIRKGDGQLIADPSKWRKGVAVKTFRGTLTEEQIGETVVNTVEGESEKMDASVSPERSGDR